MSANLPLFKNFGRDIYDLSPSLHKQLSQMYTDIAVSLNRNIKKDVIDGFDPLNNSVRNKNFSVGDVTIRTDTDTAWIMTSRTTSEDVVWTQIT